jgi:predicted membrane-bound spermidine synthase
MCWNLAAAPDQRPLLHAPYVHHIRAIDFSAKMIEIAQAKAAEQNIQNVTFEQASIDRIERPGRHLRCGVGPECVALARQ